jgi:hypothetical protein
MTFFIGRYIDVYQYTMITWPTRTRRQSTYASATIRGVGPDATYIVQQVQRQLRAVEPTVNQRVSVMQRVFGSWQCCTGKEGAV